MDNIISISNLNYKYDDKIIFSDFNLEVTKESFLTILGASGSGKTTLVKILMGLIKTSDDENIIIDNIVLNENNIKKMRKKIGVIFENIDLNFVVDNVYDNIAFTLENMSYTTKQIKSQVVEIAQYLNIEKLLDNNISELSGGEKQLVAIASILVNNPKIIILDESLSNLDGIAKNNIYSLLKKLNKEKNITIINIANDTNDSLFGTHIAIMSNGKVLINDKKENVYKEEKIFKQAKLELPFIVDLSIKLKYYELVDKIILDENKLVNELWK